MTLLTRIRGLDSSLRGAVEEEDLSLKIGRITERIAELNAAAEELERAAVASEELRSAGQHLPPETRKRIATLHAELGRAHGQLASTPLVAAEDGFYQTLQAIAGLAKDLVRSLGELWRNYQNGMSIPTVDEEFLKVLEQAGFDVAHVTNMVERGLAGLSICRSMRLPRQGDVAAFSHVVSQLRSAVEALGSMLPPAVRKFVIQAATSEGAPLDLLTEEVRTFLHQNGLAGRYRIQLAGT